MALVIPAQFLKTVTSAGTAEALVASSTIVRSAVIVAESDNTGTIYVGDSSVDSTDGIELIAGKSMTIEMPEMGRGGSDDFDLADLYIDASVSSDGVKVFYYKRS